MASMMLLKIGLNSPVGSIDVLVSTGVLVFLGTSEGREIVEVGTGTERSNTSDLTSKGGNNLVIAVSPALGSGTGAT